jgi:hypothetical protein
MAKSEVVFALTDDTEAQLWSEPISCFPRSLPREMRDHGILYCEILGFAKENRDGAEEGL